MTQGEQLGLVRWVRVTGTNAITGRCFAPDIATARDRLPCGPAEAVVSAASYALGTPRGIRLAPVVLCALCVKPLPEDRHADGMHPGCRARHQRGYANRRAKVRAQKAKHDRKADRRAAKTAWQRNARLAARGANA